MYGFMKKVTKKQTKNRAKNKIWKYKLNFYILLLCYVILLYQYIKLKKYSWMYKNKYDLKYSLIN